MFTTLETTVDKRGNKLLVYFSPNEEVDTLAAAYSQRPAKQPSVSTPINWEELGLKLKPTDFTIEKIPARLMEMGDLRREPHAPKIKTKNSKIFQQRLNQ